MTIADSYSESSYLAGLTCNLDVKSSYWQIKWQIYPPVVSSGQEWQFHISTVRAHIGRSTGRHTPTPLLDCKASWDVYYGMYFAAIVDSSRKGGNLLLFLNN